jgi:2-C-methyl-D-erythritol 4-phosphate cytidylyltransferase
MVEKTAHTTLMLLLAGSGSRFDSRVPKQFLNLTGADGNSPLFIQSIKTIGKYVVVDRLILVVSKDYIKSKEFINPLNVYKKSFPTLKIDIVEGGKTRHESFLKGAALVSPHENHTLMVHDANRPFISESFGTTIAEQIKTLSTQRTCLVPLVASTESLCKISSDEKTPGKIVDYLPRENTYRVQTPQLIFTPALEDALAKAKKFPTTDYTDEGSFMLSMGFKVFTFHGDLTNIKITTKNDVA